MRDGVTLWRRLSLAGRKSISYNKHRYLMYMHSTQLLQLAYTCKQIACDKVSFSFKQIQHIMLIPDRDYALAFHAYMHISARSCELSLRCYRYYLSTTRQCGFRWRVQRHSAAECCPVMSWLMFYKILIIDNPHSSPVWVSYGVPIVSVTICVPHPRDMQ